MLVELETRPRSRIETALTWAEISNLERTWEHAGPRDIIVVGDLTALRTKLDDAGIAHTARTRMCVTPRDFRIDIASIGSRVRVRRTRDVGRAIAIASSLGVLVIVDEAGASQGR